VNIPYASPNLEFSVFLKALFMPRHAAEQAIKAYFRALTGKKHILITNSCRSALYLVYKALGTSAEVITTPLTCRAAIDPIVESGNKPVFADIDPGNLNMDPGDISRRLTN